MEINRGPHSVDDAKKDILSDIIIAPTAKHAINTTSATLPVTQKVKEQSTACRQL